MQGNAVVFMVETLTTSPSDSANKTLPGLASPRRHHDTYTTRHLPFSLPSLPSRSSPPPLAPLAVYGVANISLEEIAPCKRRKLSRYKERLTENAISAVELSMQCTEIIAVLRLIFIWANHPHARNIHQTKTDLEKLHKKIVR